MGREREVGTSSRCRLEATQSVHCHPDRDITYRILYLETLIWETDWQRHRGACSRYYLERVIRAFKRVAIDR